MGWKFSCWCAQAIAQNMVNQFLQAYPQYNPEKTLVYIDNIYFKVPSNQREILKDFQEFCKSIKLLLSEAAIILDPSKDINQAEILGCDVRKDEIRPSKRTVDKINWLERCINTNCTGRDWICALGIWWRIAHVYRLKHAPFYYTMQRTRRISRLVATDRLDENIGLPTERLKKEIEAFISWVRKRKWRVAKEPTMTHTPIRIFTDASLTGYGAVFMGERGVFRVISRRWEDDPLNKKKKLEPGDMPELESLAIRRILWENRKTCYRSTLYTDSGTLVSAWESGRANNKTVNDAILLIHQSKMSVQHVRSEDNPADYYSRL